MNILNKQLFNATLMNTTLTSAAVAVDQYWGFSVQAAVAGTPTGTIKIQVSSDPFQGGVPAPPVPTNWTDLTSGSAALSAAGTTIFNVPNSAYSWMRVIYTDGSSGAATSTLSVRINGKG